MPSIDSSSTQYAEQARYEAAELERQRAQESHQSQIEDLKEDFAQDKKSTSEEYNARLMQEKKEAADEVRKLKEEMYNSEGKKFAKDSRDLSDQKTQLESYQQQLAKDYEARTKRLEDSMNSRLKSAEARKEEQIAENSSTLKKSQQLEVKHLNDSLKQATVDPRDLETEKAAARGHAIREVEGDANREKRYLVSAYEGSLQKMRENEEQNHNNHIRRLTENQYEVMGKANTMMREQKRDFVKRDQERVSELTQVQSEYNRNLMNERAQNQRGAEVLTRNHEKQTNDALFNQAGSLKNYYDGKDENLRYQLGESQKEAHTLKTTDNAMLASPALVNRIQRSEEDRYFKQLEAEHNHNNNQVEGLKNRDVTERREMSERYNSEIMNAHKQTTKQLDQDKALLLTSYEDLKYSKDQENQKLRDQSHANFERTHVKNAQEMDLLQRKNMESLSEQRNSLLDRNRQEINDAKFENKVQSRELLAKLSAQRREHDSRLADQALNHELQMSELKLEYDTKLREQERNSNRLMDERIKGYEQRIKEQELASKDKERFLTEHYEEEIAKMKRTNARLIQKKS